MNDSARQLPVRVGSPAKPPVPLKGRLSYESFACWLINKNNFLLTHQNEIARGK